MRIVLHNQGFHRAEVVIEGGPAQEWNDTMVALEMSREQVESMYESGACRSSDCVCGGAHRYAEPSSVDVARAGAGLYLVPVSWLGSADIN